MSSICSYRNLSICICSQECKTESLAKLNCDLDTESRANSRLNCWNLCNIYHIMAMDAVQRLGRFLIADASRWSSISARNICLTRPVLAEPPKKKRRVDPAVMKTRVERKIRKLEREIAKLERQPRQEIPLVEYNLQPAQIRDLKSETRQRHVDQAEMNRAHSEFQAACKLWSLYRLNQSFLEQSSIRSMRKSQDKALSSLKQLSPELYNKTVDHDEDCLVPFKNLDIVKDTPPDPTYSPPDGYVKDVTREWKM